MRATELLRAEIFGSVEGDQRSAAEALEVFHASPLAQRRNHLIERGLQMRGMNRVEHRTDVVVGRNALHAEQRVAVGGLAPFFERTLIGEKRLGLHEEQRKRRQADVGHRIVSRALPLVGKGGAGVMQSGQEVVENQHLDLESETQARGNQKI